MLNTLTTFKQYLYDAEKSKNTIDKYIHDVSLFLSWLNHRQITKHLFVEYKESLIQHYAPTSVNSHISAINTFLDFYGAADCKVKLLKIQRQIFTSKNKELTRSEYQRLLTTAQKQNNQRLCLLMQTICSTGIRVSELKHITVAAVKAGQTRINCKGKLRIILIPSKLCKLLSAYAAKHKIKRGSIFISKNGTPLDRTNIWAAMKKLCDSANVPRSKVFPHNLRHLFARTYYAIEKDIVRLADILGHSSIETTRLYTIESYETHRAQIEKMHLLRC